MAYIYQADLWCDDCGEMIRERITREGFSPTDPNDENTYDSDEFPKYSADPGPSDSPCHCAAGRQCVNRFRIGVRGGEVKRGGQIVPALVGDVLTSYGVQYVRESADTPLGKWWARAFSDQM